MLGEARRVVDLIYFILGLRLFLFRDNKRTKPTRGGFENQEFYVLRMSGERHLRPSELLLSRRWNAAILTFELRSKILSRGGGNIFLLEDARNFTNNESNGWIF